MGVYIRYLSSSIPWSFPVVLRCCLIIQELCVNGVLVLFVRLKAVGLFLWSLFKVERLVKRGRGLLKGGGGLWRIFRSRHFVEEMKQAVTVSC